MVTRDQEHVDGLARVAFELRSRVRNDVPVANGMWLEQQMRRLSNDYWGLVFVQACAIPERSSWQELTLWVAQREPLIPAESVDKPVGGAVDRPGYRDVWAERFFPPRGSVAVDR